MYIRYFPIYQFTILFFLKNEWLCYYWYTQYYDVIYGRCHFYITWFAAIEVLTVVCLLYTSDAADDMQCVDLGGRRIIKKTVWEFLEA